MCVLLGWLTYDYHVLHAALVLILKTMRGRAGVANFELWDDMHCNEYDCRWTDSLIFKPAFDTLKRLNKVYVSEHSMSPDLFQLPISRASPAIKKLLYAELTEKWNADGKKRCTHVAYPKWKQVKLSRFMYSRYTTRLFNRLICNRGPLRIRKHATEHCQSSLCRHGCGVDEDLEHVILRCPTYEIHRKAVKKRCHDIGVEMKLEILCSDPRLHLSMEKFVGNMKLEKLEA